MEERWVVVTTDNTRRGVFCGILKSWDEDKCIAILNNARMAIYWSQETKGVLGLASIGPQKGSKITPSVKQIELNGTTSIIDMSKEAVQQWEKQIWD